MTASAPPIVLEIRRSRAFDLGLALIGVLALAAVLASGIAIALTGPVCAVVGVVWIRALRAHTRQSGLRIAIAHDGRAIMRPAGADADAETRIVDHAVVGPLVSLRFAAGAPLRAMFLLPDCVDPDSLRRLRVRLRGLADPGAVESGIR